MGRDVHSFSTGRDVPSLFKERTFGNSGVSAMGTIISVSEKRGSVIRDRPMHYASDPFNVHATDLL